QRRLAGLLVISEVSLAVVLLAGAGVMIRSFLNTNKAEIGIGTLDVLSMDLNLPEARYPRPEDQLAFHDRLKARLDSMPGIEVSTVASDLPAESPDSYAYEVEGEPASDKQRRQVNGLVIGEDFFRALQVKTRGGRTFGATDTAGEIPAV